jgi:SAM-dependent methyltransferase
MNRDDDATVKLTERYDREAAAYRELWAPVLRQAGRGLLREIDGSSPRRVLDIGTGVGALLPDLRAAFPAAAVLGVDRSRGMLSLAPASFPRSVMDASRLALAASCVDLVVMAFMLFHLERPIEGLREVRRVLRPEGRVGSVTWGGELESKATRIWNGCLDAHGAVAPDPAAEARHDPVDTPEKMKALLHEAGFEIARAWMDEMVASIEAEHLILLKTRMGSSKPRFDSLEPGARETCVAEARRRMEKLAPRDFVARGKIVYAVGSA